MNKFLSILVAVVAGVVVGIRVEKLIPEQHAVLEVNLVPYTREEHKDSFLLSNALRQGGSIEVAMEGEFTSFLQEFDSSFEENATVNQDGKYVIRSAILNWISSKGWRLISLSADNATYVFVK